VKQPGLFPIVGRMTLMRAIARAQGVTEFARENHVVVFRRVNDQNMAALYDLRAIRQGLYADPEIYANDIVLVGESHARRVFHDFLQASGFLAAPLVTLLR
jgi:polysaccharide export outer membrane protein